MIRKLEWREKKEALLSCWYRNASSLCQLQLNWLWFFFFCCIRVTRYTPTYLLAILSSVVMRNVVCVPQTYNFKLRMFVLPLLYCIRITIFYPCLSLSVSVPLYTVFFSSICFQLEVNWTISITIQINYCSHAVHCEWNVRIIQIDSISYSINGAHNLYADNALKCYCYNAKYACVRFIQIYLYFAHIRESWKLARLFVA